MTHILVPVLLAMMDAISQVKIALPLVQAMEAVVEDMEVEVVDMKVAIAINILQQQQDHMKTQVDQPKLEVQFIILILILALINLHQTLHQVQSLCMALSSIQVVSNLPNQEHLILIDAKSDHLYYLLFIILFVSTFLNVSP